MSGCETIRTPQASARSPAPAWDLGERLTERLKTLSRNIPVNRSLLLFSWFAISSLNVSTVEQKWTSGLCNTDGWVRFAASWARGSCGLLWSSARVKFHGVLTVSHSLLKLNGAAQRTIVLHGPQGPDMDDTRQQTCRADNHPSKVL